MLPNYSSGWFGEGNALEFVMYLALVLQDPGIGNTFLKKGKIPFQSQWWLLASNSGLPVCA